MEEKQPYIVHLTGTQKHYLMNVMEQNHWNDTLFHKVDCDLSFLVDFLVAEDKRQIYLFKEVLKEALWNQRRLITQETDRKIIEESNTNTDRSEVIPKHFPDPNTEQSSDYVAASTAKVVLNNVIDACHATKAVSDNSENDNMYIDKTMIKYEKDAVIKNQSSVGEDELNNSSESVLNNTCGYIDKFNEQTRLNDGNNCSVRAQDDIVHSDSCSNLLIEPSADSHVNIFIEYADKQIFNKPQEKDGCVKKQSDKIGRCENVEVCVCTVCKMQFVDKYTLNRHQVTMHNGVLKSEYQCDLCGATMRHKGSLVQHMKSVHSDVRPHKCDVCSSTFKLHQQLKTHKRRHGQDFVDTCMVCGKTVRKGHLNSHMKRHTNDRKFKCNTCGKAFHSKQDLDRHVLLHSGDRPNKCPYCEYSCAYKGNLTKHIANRHEAELHMQGRPGKLRQNANPFNSKTSESTSVDNINVKLNCGMETGSKQIALQFEEPTLFNRNTSGTMQQDFNGNVEPQFENEINQSPDDLNQQNSSLVSNDTTKQTTYHLKRPNIIPSIYKDFNGVI